MIKPIVSVIMPTYNHANFVKQAIESVLMQKDVFFEFLIMDDGSVDSTREVVASISDPRIKFFPYTENRGAAVVTNELIERSSGEFIALINSDDYWMDDDKLSYQVEILRNNPDIGAIFGRARFVDKDGNRILTLPFGNVFEQENRTQGQWLRYFFDHSNCICHPTMLIRKTCYQELGLYNNRLRQLPDFDMWVRLIKSYKIYISERELINFRIMPGENASAQTPINMVRTLNEHLVISESFFDNVSKEQLIDGFFDYLVMKEIPTQIHLEIEKARMFMIYNQWLGKPYQIVGINKLYKLFNIPEANTILHTDYNMSDRWFHAKMGEIDVLRPTIVEKIERKASRIKVILEKFIAKVNLPQ